MSRKPPLTIEDIDHLATRHEELATRSQIVEAARRSMVTAQDAANRTAVDDPSKTPAQVVDAQQAAAREVEIRKLELKRAEDDLKQARESVSSGARQMAREVAPLLLQLSEERRVQVRRVIEELIPDPTMWAGGWKQFDGEHLLQRAAGVADRKALADALTRIGQTGADDDRQFLFAIEELKKAIPLLTL